jgi:hypothetical protein
MEIKLSLLLKTNYSLYFAGTSPVKVFKNATILSTS